MSAGAMALRGARAALVLLAVVACGSDPESGGSGPAPDASGGPRSAILITIDTLRADALGAYGSPLGATPHIDRLAAEGVLFEQAHASSPNTLPSHASILTGKRPFRHGVRTNMGDVLAAEQQSVAERLEEAGFATGAEVAAIVLADHTGIDQGFQRFRDTESPDVVLPEVDPALPGDLAISYRTRDAEDITARGIEFLEARAPDEPFFLWLHYYDPHWPQTPPEAFARRFQERIDSGLPDEEEAEEKRFIRKHLYAAEVAYVDDQLGRLLEVLERRGLDDRTLLIVTSDHGEAMGEHGEDTHSYFVYQSTMHIPLLLRGPGLPAGVRVPGPVRSVDVAPTLLEWLEQPGLEEIDGRSLLPLLDGASASESERIVYGESIELKRVFGVPVLRFVREGPWKYIHKPQPSLYHLDDDPAEREDLAASEPERIVRLRERLEELMAGTGTASQSGADLDPETAAQLEALGYAAGTSSSELGDELDSLEVEGPDPDDMFEDVKLITRVWVEDGDMAAHARRMGELAERYPQSVPVLAKLLDTQLAYGLAEDALVTLRRGIELDPENERFWSNHAELLVKLGRRDEASEVLPEALERFPCEHTSRINLAGYLAQDGDHAARIALLEEGVEADCEEPSPQLANELAWALATAPDAALRDGARAVELALSAVEALPDAPLVLDTLAAAQAESGRLEAARETMQHALALARAQRLPEAAQDVLRQHEAALRAGRPIRE